jgi:hypothetical protein
MKSETKFWFVWNPEGRNPTVKHQTKASAIHEAERLARSNRHHTFIVLEAIGAVRVRELEWTALDTLSAEAFYTDPDDDDLPF